MSSEQQGVCLSRPQFVSLYHTHLEPSPTEQDGALDAFARMVLNRHCREYQLSVVDNYPSQPRPHDLIPRDLDRLNSWSGHYGFRISCVRAVTPKANGLEAFFVSHRYGYAVVQRNGVVRSRRWNVPQQHVYSVILEGEVVGNNIFVAYDCLATSALFGLQTLYTCLVADGGLRATGSNGNAPRCPARRGPSIAPPIVCTHAHTQREVGSSVDDDRRSTAPMQAVFSCRTESPSCLGALPRMGATVWHPL